MLNPAIQVSVNPAGYFRLKTKKCGQHRENYFRDYYQAHREKLLTSQRREQQKFWIAQKRAKKSISTSLLLWSDYFTCKKPWCNACIRAGIKETEYKFCGENCSVKYWITIYSEIGKKEKERDQKEREKVNKKRRKGVNDKISSHTVGTAHTLAWKESFFLCVRGGFCR